MSSLQLQGFPSLTSSLVSCHSQCENKPATGWCWILGQNTVWRGSCSLKVLCVCLCTHSHTPGNGCHTFSTLLLVLSLGKYTWKNTMTRIRGWNSKMKESKEARRRRKRVWGRSTDLEVEMGIPGETVLHLEQFNSSSLQQQQQRSLGGDADFERPSGRRNIIRIFRDNLLTWNVKPYFSCVLPGPKYPLRFGVIWYRPLTLKNRWI